VAQITNAPVAIKIAADAITIAPTDIIDRPSRQNYDASRQCCDVGKVDYNGGAAGIKSDCTL
jgi:hypothetical protein